MAKNKRASIKDKSPESLGMTQKKNKGIDLLFGGAVDKEGFDADDQLDQFDIEEEHSSVENTSISNSSTGSNRPASERLVDEFGLPVALESPPDDLILASDPLTSTSQTEDITFDASTSPFTFPETEDITDNTTDDVNDLSGLVVEETTPTLEGENLSSSEEKETLSSLVDDTESANNDLAGLATDANDLSGLLTTPPTPTEGNLSNTSLETESVPTVDAANDLSGLIVEETGSTSTAPHTPPPPPTTPPSTVTDFGASSPQSNPTYNYTPPPTISNDPVGTATTPNYSSVPIDRAPAGVINALSTFAEAVPVTRQSFSPQDEFAEVGDHVLSVTEFQAAEKDAALTEKILNYVGSERRDKLFSEVETLYDAVTNELGGNKNDANFALDTLRQAHNLILEDPREYDEAFYRVAIVKTMLNRKTNLRRWSYTWGLFVLLYAIAWLVPCAIGVYWFIDNMLLLQDAAAIPLVHEAIFSGMAGGVGGVVTILWTLYYRVSVKQDFDRQYLMWYLVKPILGLVLGFVMYFLLIAASSMFGSPGPTPGFDTVTGIALSFFFGFVAGFRQDNVYDWIYVIVKAISPKATEESQSKTPLVPYELQEDIITN